MVLLSDWRKPCDNEDLKNKHQTYLARSDRYDGLDKNLFEAQQSKSMRMTSLWKGLNTMRAQSCQSIDRWEIRQDTLYVTHITCHLKKNDSFLVLQCCLNERTPLQTSGILIFIIRFSTCFTRVDFSSARMGIFFTRLYSSVARVSLAARTA